MTNALSHSDSLFAKLSKYRAKLLIFLAALQALLLIGIAGSHYNILWNGTEIRIATVPVDPRDLLYGDYVNLRYEISHLQPELWKDDAIKPKRGDAVYVVLRSTGAEGTMQAVAAYGHQPAVAAGETLVSRFIKWKLGMNNHPQLSVSKTGKETLPSLSGADNSSQSANVKPIVAATDQYK